MRLGINFTPEHRSPEEWADILAANGYRACVFPVDHHASVSEIDAYQKAARDRDLTIAEVGVWNSPWATDPGQAKKAREDCLEQFRLAEYIGAGCCVNVSGAAGPEWPLCYEENYSPRLYEKNVAFLQELCDTVKPKNTFYCLEPMQWMLPDSPEAYARLLEDVDRPGFAVHMDYINFIKDPYTYTHQEELIDRCFSLLGGQIKSCHLKDCLMEKGLTVMVHEVLPGTGQAQMMTYLKAIERLEDLPVLLEHLPDMDAFQRATANVRSLWAREGRGAL